MPRAAESPLIWPPMLVEAVGERSRSRAGFRPGVTVPIPSSMSFAERWSIPPDGYEVPSMSSVSVCDVEEVNRSMLNSVRTR